MNQPSSIFPDFITQLRRSGRNPTPLPTLASTFARLVDKHVPGVRLVNGSVMPTASTSGASPCVYTDGAVAVSGAAVTPAHLGRVVQASHALRSALRGEGSDDYPAPVAQDDFEDAETDDARRALSAIQLGERGALLRALMLPLGRPRSPEHLEWAAEVLEIWAREDAHPLDLATDPAGYGSAQVARAGRASMTADMAREAAQHWRVGTPGTDAEDAPEVAWEVIRALTVQMAADDLELSALSVMFPGA